MATLWKHSDGRQAEMLGWIAIHNIYSSSEGRNLAFTDFPSEEEETLACTPLTVGQKDRRAHGDTSQIQVIKKWESALADTPKNNPSAAWNLVVEIVSASFNERFDAKVTFVYSLHREKLWPPSTHKRKTFVS